MAIALSARDPQVAPDQLLGELGPPPTFATVSLASYEPDPSEPSQQVALNAAREFVAQVVRPTSTGRRWLRRRRPGVDDGLRGLYLDGGFGVGKTHLLASIWHQAPAPKLYATFVELTHLVGALGFAESVERLSAYRLLCIDEFELDDPGDTVLVSSLLGRLVARGVWIAATSNTLPDALGQGRFASDDFLREIQALAAQFTVVRIDGPDYRHRQLDSPAPPLADGDLQVLSASRADASYDHFVDLCRHLEQVHPSRYGALVDGVGLVCLSDVRPLADQNTALRIVVLVDRLYDRGIPVATSGTSLSQVFSDDMLRGGYRKKYRRALSRLTWLSTRGTSAARQQEDTE